MSTTAHDEARDEYVASTGWTMSEAHAIADGYDAGFDAGRASVLSALTEERIADEVAHWPIGSGYYQTPKVSVGL